MVVPLIGYYSDKAKIEKITNALKLKVPPRDLSQDDPKQVVQAIMSRWLPLADTMLEAVVEQLPSPVEAQKNR